MHLPLINNSEEAIALAEQTHDDFYLAAFRLQVWLSELSIQAVAEYADKPKPEDRAMQTGQAWRTFFSALGGVSDENLYQVIQCLTRFSECDNPLSQLLLRALAPIYLEHDFSGDFLGPKAPDLSQRPRQLALLMLRSVQRACDWLDAAIHLQTHGLWFKEPACFDPDPETRRLAARELSQPYVAQMGDPSLTRSYLQSPETAQRIRVTPESQTSRPSRSERPWPFPKFDEAVIVLWPLLKLHNWTYADFWNVLRDAGLQSHASPCKNHRQLAAYCCGALGLRKTGHGQTARNAKPAGYAFAKRLLRPPHRSSAIGQAPWS